MHYVDEQMIDERQQEIVRMRRGTRTAVPPVPGWRRRAGQALVAMGVAVAVPSTRRRAATREAAGILCLEPPC